MVIFLKTLLLNLNRMLLSFVRGTCGCQNPRVSDLCCNAFFYSHVLIGDQSCIMG